jgi:hypothetical protein
MRLNKKLAKKILGDVEEGNRFFCSDGKVFSNLEDLKEGIKEMSDEVFLHHTGEGRNDFSNWISGCLGDVRLADSLVGLDREATLKKIRARLDYIERYLEKNL